MLALVLTIGAGVVASSMLLSRTQDTLVAAAHERERMPQACASWHAAASEAAATLLREAAADVDFRLLNDIVFKMRRGLRNCRAGWLKLACEDFRVAAHAKRSTVRPFTCTDHVQQEISASIDRAK